MALTSKNALLIFSREARMKTTCSSRNLSNKSRGSQILKAVLQKNSKCIDKEGNMSIDDEVVSPEIRVGPAEKEKHSVIC